MKRAPDINERIILEARIREKEDALGTLLAIDRMNSAPTVSDERLEDAENRRGLIRQLETDIELLDNMINMITSRRAGEIIKPVQRNDFSTDSPSRKRGPKGFNPTEMGLMADAVLVDFPERNRGWKKEFYAQMKRLYIHRIGYHPTQRTIKDGLSDHEGFNEIVEK